MGADTIVPLIQNAALLVAIAVLADNTSNRWAPGQMARGQVLIGLLVGLTAVAVMATPLRLEPGIIFDVRSVLLSLSGLFFGSVATVVAAIVAIIYRVFIGGAGLRMGVASIASAAGIGMLWRRLRRARLADLSWKELFVFGFSVHVAALLLMLVLLGDAGPRAVGAVALPFLGLFPIATAVAGTLLVNRIHRSRQRTALETALRERDTLLVELRHRVKNSMATISSVISIEHSLADSASSRSALSSVGGRVTVLSRLYDLLHQNGANDVRLDDYLGSLVSSVVQSHPAAERITATADLAEVTVDSKRASALGLILNELLTNSLKYAFPAGRAGSVRVATRTQGGRLSIEVSDDGIGLSTGAAGSSGGGVGLQLVDGLVQQLNGELSRSGQNGTRIEISLPLN